MSMGASMGLRQSTVVLIALLLFFPFYQNCSRGFNLKSTENSEITEASIIPENRPPTKESETKKDDPISLPSGVVPKWLQGAAVHQWVEIPNTKLSELQNAPMNPGKIAFSGLAIKKSDSTLIRWGGGHSDYSGSDVDAITMNTDVPAWRQVSPSTPNEQIVPNQQWWGSGTDLKPNPGHTYQSLQFIESRNRLFLSGKLLRLI